MAGKKLTAAERLAKLKKMQGKRGEEFAGGKKKPVSEPPRTPAQEEPSVFDKPPAKPVQEEPEEDNNTQGLDLDDSAVVDVSEEAPAPSSAPSTKLDSKPPVQEEPEKAEPAPVGDDEPASVEPPSLEGLVSPDALVGEVESSSEREDETKPEVPKRPSRTLLSAELEADPVSALSEPEEKSPEVEESEPEGTKYHVNAQANQDRTNLVSGITVTYVMASASSKIFMVNGPNGATESLDLAPGNEKSFEMDTPDGKVSVVMQNRQGEVKAYVKGGKTKAAVVAAKAGRAGKFLANVRYYLPELTMAGLFTAATTAVLWTQQFVSDTLQNLHKPAVIAYGVFQLALTAWAFVEQRKTRNAAEAKEAVKE